jgi:hypothetical protein
MPSRHRQPCSDVGATWDKRGEILSIETGTIVRTHICVGVLSMYQQLLQCRDFFFMLLIGFLVWGLRWLQAESKNLSKSPEISHNLLKSPKSQE